MTEDYPLIQAAFARLNVLESLYGDTIPNSAIREGFNFASQQILFETQAKGIFKPRQMKAGALSIKTTMSRTGGVNFYNDQLVDDGFYHYSLQAGDPYSSANRQLWQSYELKQPLIYFHAVAPAVYTALWPCTIDSIAVDVKEPFIRLVVGHRFLESAEYSQLDSQGIESRYLVRESKTRLHQATFREAVLRAYGRRCAITGLKEDRLIEAAHIIPDGEIGEKQFVNNGIALSRIHHKAYDSRLLGIDPDLKFT
ncbi:MAG: HNH endonuclease [marine bacterium B5-7]|nr:MAG: HNH endonuclease [marine bacterium B5-7]